LTDFAGRIIGAARLNVAIYEEVEADRTATTQAMVVVILASLAAGIGSIGVGEGAIRNIVVGSIGGLVSWVIWAFMTYVIGTRLFPEPQTEADTAQLMRTLGFAQAPGLARVFVGAPLVGPLVLLVVSVWMLVAMVIAVRQALDYQSTWRAVAVCIVGWIIAIVIPMILILTTGAPRASF
jgi:Yip1-like protein